MNKATILIVEDEAIIAADLAGKLGRLGYEVCGTAARGEEAVGLACELQPNLVLMDIRLAGAMDGVAAAEAIRRECDVPVIYLTAHSDSATLERAKLTGPFGYILKPFEGRELATTIEMALFKHQAERKLRQAHDELEKRVEERTRELKEAERELRETNETLEQRVAERTAELEAANTRLRESRLAALNMMEDAVAAHHQADALMESLQQAHDELEHRVEERTIELASALNTLQDETTERLRAVDELRKKEQMLQEQSRQAALGEMIGNIAHQWRQPLNVLGLIIQELPMMHETGEFTADYLTAKVEKAKEVLFHMSRTIDDFRNFFRPDKEKVPFRVSEAVTRALSLIQGSFDEQEIAVEVNAVNDPLVDGYPNEFSQVLLNILINARDAFTERDIPLPRIVTITLANDGGKPVMTVADNAGGIPEEILDKIFDPYFTTKGPDRGTGIGLFMAKTIIEKNMHGRLTARNAGQGAEFRIEV